MSDDNKQDPSFQETDLDSPAYRERLLRKLNCLIAVLEVASVKVQKTLKGPEPDVDRLLRIRGNLNKTLDVCMRARKALQEHRQIPEELHKNLSRITADGAAGHRQRNLKALPKGASTELSGDAEKRKFERLGPITADSISEVDFDDLSSQF